MFLELYCRRDPTCYKKAKDAETKKQSDMVNARKIFLRQFSALGSVREESMIDFEGLTLKLRLIIWALVRGKLFEEFRSFASFESFNWSMLSLIF